MYKDIGRITRSYIYSEMRFCPDDVSTVSKPKPEVKEKTDPRFKNHYFKVAVRQVLADLGLESTHGNFRRYKDIIDWEEYAANLQGDKVQGIARISKTVFAEVRATSKAAAIRLIQSRGFTFAEWVDFDKIKGQVYLKHLPGNRISIVFQ